VATGEGVELKVVGVGRYTSATVPEEVRILEKDRIIVREEVKIR